MSANPEWFTQSVFLFSSVKKWHFFDSTQKNNDLKVQYVKIGHFSNSYFQSNH